MAEELPLFALWEKVLGDLFDRTAKFPKAVRFTFTTRIDNLALDILEGIVEARYAGRERKPRVLATVDLALTKLRVLLRLAHARGHLPTTGLEHLARQIDEAGRMLGGWRKQQAGG